jgi:hypothetical protein
MWPMSDNDITEVTGDSGPGPSWPLTTTTVELPIYRANQLAAAEQFVKDELVYLWGQLWDAYQMFLDSTWIGQPQKRWQEGGSWSGRCEGLATRIGAATGIVGPVSWGNIPMTALVDGWFSWANQRIGIVEPDMPNNDQLDVCRRQLAAQMHEEIGGMEEP